MVCGLVDDDLTQMQPDAEHQSLFLVEYVVEACHPLLEVDRRRHRRHRRAEFGQHGVGHDVHDPAARGFDGRLPHLGVYRLEATDRAVFRTFHQAHVAGEVGVKDGREPAATGRYRYPGWQPSGRLSSAVGDDMMECLSVTNHKVATPLVEDALVAPRGQLHAHPLS